MTGPGTIRIGTSGWHYQHWVGRFYPDGMASEDLLGYYARRFETVEINNTFYQLPSRETLVAWRDGTPDGFLFACKASRYITHMKKLKDPKDSTARFFEAVEALGDKLGPVLFQLPPRWHVNVDRLAAFVDTLPDGLRYAFEFRDETWFTDEVAQCLAARDAAFCVYDLAGRQSPLTVTADLVYVRLHGPNGAYAGSYDDRALKAWAKRLLTWSNEGRAVYCYFDNDEAAYAAANAQRLIELVAQERR